MKVKSEITPNQREQLERYCNSSSKSGKYLIRSATTKQEEWDRLEKTSRINGI